MSTATFAPRDDASCVLREMPAGLELTQFMASLDPLLLDPDAQLAYVEACERQQAWWQARQDRAIVAFVGSNPRQTPYFVRGDAMALIDARQTELAAALHWSEAVAGARISTARVVARELPQTNAAADRGELPGTRVRAIADAAAELVAPIDEIIDQARTDRVDADQIAQLCEMRTDLLTALEARVLEFAASHTLARTREKLRATLHRLDPEGAALRRRRAARNRSDVTIRHDHDGLSTITATMPSEHGMACWNRINQLAENGPADEPAGLRRAKALAAMACSVHGAGTPDGADAVATGVNLDLVMDLTTYLALNDAAASMQGAGPIPAEVARALLTDAAHVTLRRVITDPSSGAQLDTGVHRYLLTDTEREHIRQRDGRCRFMDCGQPAHRCECDHAIPYDEGGPTRTANLGLACKRHHQCKTHAGWRVIESRSDGGCTWVSPLGRTYVHTALPVLPWMTDELASAGVAANVVSQFSHAGGAQEQLRALRDELHRLYAEHTGQWAFRHEVENPAVIAILEEAEMQVLDHQQLPALAVASRHGDQCAMLHTLLTRHMHGTSQAAHFPRGLLHDGQRSDECPF